MIRSLGRRMRLFLVFGGAGALAVAGTFAAQAQEVQTGQAPPGKAEAYAAHVEGVAAIGHSKAEAGAEGGSATGNALELGGEPPSEQFGGTQEGPGSSSGALVDTGESEAFRLRVTPWSAEVQEDGNGTKARGAAALLDLTIGQELVKLAVLQSQSQATHNGTSSTGSASSDGAKVNVGGEDGLTLTVLHAETTSEGQAESYLLGIQDEKLLTSDDAGGNCRVEIPSVVGLACLSASGGKVGEEAAASVVDATVGGEDGLVAQVVGARSTGRQSAAAELGAGQEPAAPAPEPDAGGRGALAATGGGLTASAATGMVLLIGGVAARELRRRVAR